MNISPDEGRTDAETAIPAEMPPHSFIVATSRQTPATCRSDSF